MRAAEIKPLARLYWLLCLVMYCGGTGDSARALRAVTEGLALAEASGIRLLDVSFFIYGTYGQLYAGNVGHARELLRRMSFAVGQRGRGVDAFYHHNASMVLLHEGDATRAVEEGRLCVELSKPLGLYTGVLSGQLNLAYAYAARGDADAALQAATEAYDLANRMRSKLFRSFSRFAEANVWRMRGDRERTLGALDEALTLAFEMGHVTSSACPRDAAAALYAMALDAGIQTDYVRRVIAKTGLPPPADLLPENWPWPIRIYTLGHTSIVKEETPLVFAGKAQKKPLDLLHVLIALGGRDVSVARLANALWPDAEGDMARTALRTTLHRLRRLLGERSIVLQDSTLTLNPEYCWVDVWAFERIGEQADRMRDARRLMALYRGPFLQDDDMPHVVVERERLRARFLQLVERVGQAAEEGGDDETALWLYQAAIEVEPLAESLYRRLMCCHLRLNRPADAVAVYRRCEAALRSLLGVEPSPDTRVLLPCGGRESRRRSN